MLLNALVSVAALLSVANAHAIQHDAVSNNNKNNHNNNNEVKYAAVKHDAAKYPTTTTKSTLSSTSNVVSTTISATASNSIASSALSSIKASVSSCVGKGLNTNLYHTAHTTYTHPKPTSTANAKGDFTNWNTFKANGVNLGGWFEVETSNNPEFFEQWGPDAPDEWTLCGNLGPIKCAIAFEQRYATFVTTADIDKLAAVGE